MESFTFRPSLERLENRETPASVAQVAFLAAQTQATAAVISHLVDYDWLANPVMRPQVQQFVRGIYTQSNAAMSGLTPQAGAIYGVAQSNSAFAQHVASWLGFPIVPPPPPKPVTPDSGMTNHKPPVNSPSWVLQANGLKTWDVVQGTGTPVAPGATITIFYTGWLTNGTVFDSKRSPANPAQFALGTLIQGWQQGIPGMKNGGIRRLYVPAALAYGANGQGSVPPNSDLIFEIKLISHT